MRLQSMFLTSVLILMIALSGCIFSPDDDDSGGGTEPVDYPFPDEPDVLMQNVVDIHSNMDFTAYSEMIHDDYRFVMLPETVEQYSYPVDYLTREEDLDGAENMFNAISGFDITLTGQGSWETESEQHIYFAGALKRVYQMDAAIDGGAGTTYLVTGNVTFYVKSRMEMHDGVETPYYQLLGQVDHTTEN